MDQHRYTLLIIFLYCITIHGFGEESSAEIFPDAEVYIEQFKTDQECVQGTHAYVQEFILDLRQDFPFRSGMILEEIKQRVYQNNTMLRRRGQEQPEPSGIPIYANRANHLYIYIMGSENLNTLGNGYLGLWTNGRHQFWIDMTIEQYRVKNIYLVPGNFSWMLPPLRFDGIGEHVERWNYSGSK